MTEATPSWTLWREPGVKYYLGLCVAGLGLSFLVLNHRGLSFASAVLPMLVGAAGVAIGWERTPLVYLMMLAGVISVEPNRGLMSSIGGNSWLTDLLLCCGALAFVSAQYRLQGLLKNIFPQALKPGQDAAATLARGPTPSALPRRDARAVTPREVGSLLLALPAWALAAHLVANLLPTTFGNPGLRPAAWRAMTLLWMLGVAALVIAGIFDYFQRRQMTGAEAMLFLQDEVWRQTRGEQRRINRWVAWMRRNRAQNSVGRFFDGIALLSDFAWMAMQTLWLVILVYAAFAVLSWLQQM
jgi:hypothetical protein